MAWGLIAAAVAGLGLEVYGKIKSAEEEADARRKAAALQEMQATELERRQKINEDILGQREGELENEYLASFGPRGGQGLGLGGVIRMRRNFELTLKNMREDAAFKAKMTRLGAQNQLQLASDAVTASYISGAGSILTGAAHAYSIYGDTKTPKESAWSGGSGTPEYVDYPNSSTPVYGNYA